MGRERRLGRGVEEEVRGLVMGGISMFLCVSLKEMWKWRGSVYFFSFTHLYLVM